MKESRRKHSPPPRTVDTTIFEMWLVLAGSPKSVITSNMIERRLR